MIKLHDNDAIQYYQYLFIKFPVAGVDVELPRLEATSCRKVSRLGLLPDVLPVLPDVLFVPLAVLPPEVS